MSDETGGNGKPESRAADPTLPTLNELRADVAKTPQDPRRAQRFFERRFRAVSLESESAYEHLKGLRSHYQHKSSWSTFLMWTMGLLLGFQSLLLGMVGAGVWDFTRYEWLLPSLMVQNLAAIIGLAVVVVKALFKDIAPPQDDADDSVD
jgi:hypothetical protein